MTDRIDQLAFSSFRFLFCFLAVFSGVVPLWASDGPDDDMKETEEEACGPLQIKSQTELCSADYYIKGGIEQDKEDDRKRKNIGVGENISFLLIGKPRGDIKELIWSIKGDGFQPTDNESFKGEQKIALSARKDLTKDTRVTITAKTGEGKEAKITVNIRIPKKITKEKYEGHMDLGDGFSANTADLKISKGEHGVWGFVKVTLFPTDVSFKGVKVIERDGGLMWEGKNGTPPRPQPELAAEHVTCNMAAPIQDKNNFYDMVGDNRNIEEVLETIRRSKHNPQQFWFVCNFHIHWGKGGKGSEQQDSIFLGTTNQKYRIEAIDQNTTKTVVEKFGITFTRTSNED